MPVEPIHEEANPIESARIKVREQYWQKAQEQYANNQLAEAVKSLLIVDAVDPGMLGLQSQIHEIQSVIEAKKTQLIDEARWAFEHDDQKKGLSLLLRAMALDPTDESVRLMILDRNRTIAEAKIAKGPTKGGSEYLASVDEALPAGSNDRVNVLFEEALALIEDDPERARSGLTQVLKLDPTHVGARAYLDLLPLP